MYVNSWMLPIWLLVAKSMKKKMHNLTNYYDLRCLLCRCKNEIEIDRIAQKESKNPFDNIS